MSLLKSPALWITAGVIFWLSVFAVPFVFRNGWLLIPAVLICGSICFSEGNNILIEREDEEKRRALEAAKHYAPDNIYGLIEFVADQRLGGNHL